MDLEQAIRARRSVRAYRPDLIPREEIESLVEIAGLAPSSYNSQPWHFHIATGAAREAVQSVLSQTTRHIGEFLQSLAPEEAEMAEDFFAELGHAPVLMAVSVPSSDDELERINALLAVGGAIQNLQLAATARTFATCSITFSFWVRDELAQALEVPDDREIVSVVLLGKPAESPETPARREDICTFLE